MDMNRVKRARVDPIGGHLERKWQDALHAANGRRAVCVRRSRPTDRRRGTRPPREPRPPRLGPALRPREPRCGRGRPAPAVARSCRRSPVGFDQGFRRCLGDRLVAPVRDGEPLARLAGLKEHGLASGSGGGRSRRRVDRSAAPVSVFFLARLWRKRSRLKVARSSRELLQHSRLARRCPAAGQRRVERTRDRFSVRTAPEVADALDDDLVASSLNGWRSCATQSCTRSDSSSGAPYRPAGAGRPNCAERLEVIDWLGDLD